MSESTTEGWGVIPPGQRKAHYFVSRTALCHGWGFYNGPLEPDGGPSTDDCAKCRRLLDHRKTEARRGSQ